MSRVFEALQQLNRDIDAGSGSSQDASFGSSQFAASIGVEAAGFDSVSCFSLPHVSESRLVAATDPNSLAAEKLRGLAARLRQAQQRRGLKKLLVASAVRGDGKSMMSTNLAITLASHGDRTLLIDGDLHKPTLHHLLGVRQPRGFANWSQERGPITEYLWKEDRLPLWLLPAGKCSDQPLDSIQSQATSDLLKRMEGGFAWIVIDSPPLVPLADSTVWASLCDAVLLVVREGKTPRTALAKAAQSVDKSKLFGVVLNDADTPESKYYSQYYSG